MGFLLLLLLFAIACEAQYQPWSPAWMPRDDIVCLDYCNREPTKEEIERCCTCHSRPTWLGSTVPLYIEPVSILGKSLVIPYQQFNNASLYNIEYTYKQLRYFPSNLCNWDFDGRISNLYSGLVKLEPFWGNIVRLDFSHNELKEIIKLSCLSRLDTLDLSFNQITHLLNTTFQHLTYLRVLLLKNNNIQTMDSTVVSAPSLSLQSIDLSNNQLTELDITNFFSLHPFCSIEYNSNPITEFVNPSGFQLDTSMTYGPGMVEIKDTKITQFPDFKELLHLDSLAELGTLMSFGFDLRGMPINCDCNLEPFMALAEDLIKLLWRDYFNITCDAPPNLKGKSVKHFVDPNNRHKLICDLSDTRECSRYNCTCINQPSSNTLFVNCSGRNLTEIPDPLPPSKFSTSISLDLSNNDIKELTNTSYLQNVAHLSLANNNLMVIHEEAALVLENASVIDLSNNENLRVIPPVVQYRPNGSIILNNLTIRCDCDSTWIQDSKHLDYNNFTCRVPNHGDMVPEQFSLNMLDCDDSSSILIVLSIVLGLVVALLMIAGGMIYWLRYEILIFIIRCKQAAQNKIIPILTYDAFLSFDDDDDDLRAWINTMLVPYLEQAGYKIFVPLRDLTFGDPRELNTLDVMNKTRNLLIVLSESYTLKEQKIWLQHEWKYGWNMFKRDRNKNIVMINFDQILTSDISQSQIKAFLRVGGPIDFSNIKRNILEQICHKLGPPLCTIKAGTKPVVDKKLFSPWELFVVKDNVDKQNNVIDWRTLENRHGTPDVFVGQDGQDKQRDDLPNLRADSFHSSLLSNSRTTLSETNIDYLVTERQRPAFGRYNYYV